MAESAASIQSRLTAIRNARDSGVLIVRHGDESTQFRSLVEMNKIISDLENQLATANGDSASPRVRYIRQDCKGL